MSEAIRVIEQEIDRRRAEISVLEGVLSGLKTKQMVFRGRQTNQQLAENISNAFPAKPADESSEGGLGGTFTVNGVDFELGPKAFPLAKAIGEAEDCVPIEQLTPMFGGNQQYVRVTISVLNKKFRTAGAHIVHFKGEGYRLQNIEEGS